MCKSVFALNSKVCFNIYNDKIFNTNNTSYFCSVYNRLETYVRIEI